jgi:hypothetical protein
MAALTRRYMVMTLATAAPFDPGDVDGAFVLKPWKDPAALRALRAYRDNCFPELRRDIDAWIRLIEAGPKTRGDIGRRNEPHLRAAAKPKRAAASRPARRRPAKKKPGKKRRR